MKRILYLVMAALMVVVVSCKKDPKGKSPSVRTLEVTEIQATGATLHARIDFAGTNWGGVNYGFYWGASEDALDSYIMADELLDEENAYFAKLSGLAPETQYWYKAFIEIDDKSFSGETLNFTTSSLPEGAVDLGIVMTRVDGTTYNLYWAASNLCEDGLCPNPEDYGDYYAWGETETKDNYSWSTYQFGTSDSGPFSKYNTNSSYGAVDNKTVLETGPNGDDVASKKLGGKWRMPTDEEWTALRTNCTWTWTSNYNNTGIAGRIVKSNVSGYTDKSIFLPAAGGRSGTNLSGAGSRGSYWSSSLSTDYPLTAWGVGFGSGGVYRGNDYRRCYGLSVRPVYED